MDYGSGNAEFELRTLDRRTGEVWNRCQNTLQRVLGGRCTLQYLSATDRRRLLVLLVWEERYRVSLEWIVEVLLNIYTKLRKGGRKATGLPVAVRTLVSKRSEEMIELAVTDTYPDNENLTLWEQYEQDIILDRLYEKEFEGRQSRPRAELMVLNFQKFYGKRMEDKREWMEKKMEELKNKSLPYRGNPFK